MKFIIVFVFIWGFVSPASASIWNFSGIHKEESQLSDIQMDARPVLLEKQKNDARQSSDGNKRKDGLIVEDNGIYIG